MNFQRKEALEILERTPEILTHLLSGLSHDWLTGNEGDESWNSLEVVAHLIECEKNNWIPRVSTILSSNEIQALPPFNRFSHLGMDMKLDKLLLEFKQCRQESLLQLNTILTSNSDFEKTGLHPEFGSVTLKQLLSTWVVHDLTHLNQITRVFAKRYQDDVGPWKAYLSILK
ncbi:DinB family protein [Fictibacillus sp. b24]|uniref:DinB family protein n=1 Tax=Fictibacillus sp. b24 TaxID=3055863 RepID=UPI0025A1AE3D|nr:DinB family protein [Fictibacillus sp. b24]MDM5317437.1 DinB family protein [Fictibacillus sp. b24]